MCTELQHTSVCVCVYVYVYVYVYVGRTIGKSCVDTELVPMLIALWKLWVTIGVQWNLY